MLLQFSVENYRSILDEAMFSMMADDDQTNKHRHHNSLIDTPQGYVLPVSLIYGANGSGKTNFLKAMDLMRRLGGFSQQNDELASLYKPHKLSEKGCPTTLRAIFLVHGIMYYYSLSFDKNEILSESLYFSPNNRKAKIFERDRMNVTYGSKFKANNFRTGKSALTPSRSFLACSGKYNPDNIPVHRFYETLRRDFILVFSESSPDFENYTKEVIFENPELKKQLITLMNDFDIPVKEIEMEKERIVLKPDQLPDFLTEDFRKAFIDAASPEYISVILRYQDFEMDLNEESNGVRKLFVLFGPLLDVLQSGKTLIYDELETSLHESVLLKLIELFMKQAYLRSSQLIFTTHDTGPLDLEILRKDQIWFSEDRTSLMSRREYRSV